MSGYILLGSPLIFSSSVNPKVSVIFSPLRDSFACRPTISGDSFHRPVSLSFFVQSVCGEPCHFPARDDIFDRITELVTIFCVVAARLVIKAVFCPVCFPVSLNGFLGVMHASLNSLLRHSRRMVSRNEFRTVNFLPRYLVFPWCGFPS